MSAIRLRSLLFVPGDRPDRMAKALASGADALILDLEDSVAPDAKAAARDAARAFLGAHGREVPLYVRINPFDTAIAAEDLAAILPARPSGIVLPKATPLALEQLAVAMGGNAVPVLPIVETSMAVLCLPEFAEMPGLAALTWGGEDLGTELGTRSAARSGASGPLAIARALSLFAARAAGVPAIETVYANFRDLAGLETAARQAAEDGFDGMLAIHPDQIAAIHRAMAPSDAQRAEALAIVAAFNGSSPGAQSLGGRMIDRPHLIRAERLIARSGE